MATSAADRLRRNRHRKAGPTRCKKRGPVDACLDRGSCRSPRPLSHVRHHAASGQGSGPVQRAHYGAGFHHTRERETPHRCMPACIPACVAKHVNNTTAQEVGTYCCQSAVGQPACQCPHHSVSQSVSQLARQPASPPARLPACLPLQRLNEPLARENGRSDRLHALPLSVSSMLKRPGMGGPDDRPHAHRCQCATGGR